jgi:hypothetical protein
MFQWLTLELGRHLKLGYEQLGIITTLNLKSKPSPTYIGIITTLYLKSKPSPTYIHKSPQEHSI